MTAVVYSSLKATPSNDVGLPMAAARQQQYPTMLPPALTPPPPPPSSSLPLYEPGQGVELIIRSNGAAAVPRSIARVTDLHIDVPTTDASPSSMSGRDPPPSPSASRRPPRGQQQPPRTWQTFQLGQHDGPQQQQQQQQVPNAPPTPPFTSPYPSPTFAPAPFGAYMSSPYQPYGPFHHAGYDLSAGPAPMIHAPPYPFAASSDQSYPPTPPIYQTPSSPPSSPLPPRPPRLQQAHSQQPPPQHFQQYYLTPGYPPAFSPLPYQQTFPHGAFSPTQPAFTPQGQGPQMGFPPFEAPHDLSQAQQQGGWWFMAAPPPMSAPQTSQGQSPFVGGQYLPDPSFQPPGGGRSQAALPGGGGRGRFGRHGGGPGGPAMPFAGSPLGPSSGAGSMPLGDSHPRHGADAPKRERKAYHPRAPQNRSEWVMWTGNVPADANEDELRALFGTDAGVTSLHLIARSNCAFVNFDTQDALLAAVARFDGTPARAGDPRCPRLVCRVRRKEDDLRAGVGAQRGTGVHRTWVKDVNGPGQQQTPSPESSTQGNRQGKVRHQSSGSDSYASTDSDLLGQHFPRRFFILKSLSQHDLDLSVETGLWATQSHNEEVLDRAFRTSKDVFLIFGVNKAGEFFGYARMAGPIRGERRVSWAESANPAMARDRRIADLASPPQATYFSPSEHRLAEASPVPLSVPVSRAVMMSASMLVPSQAVSSKDFKGLRRLRMHTATDPMPNPSMSGTTTVSDPSLSAPATIEPTQAGLPPDALPDLLDARTIAELAAGEVLPPHALVREAAEVTHPVIDLDPAGPAHAAHAARIARATAPALGPIGEENSQPEDDDRRRTATAPAGLPEPDDAPPTTLEPVNEDADGVKRVDTLELERRRGSAPGTAPEREHEVGPGGARDSGELWGASFKVEWVRTERLPFWRTRQLRNPWNQDREVKVSRDGTELEPGVGQRLLDEWDAPAPAPPPSPGSRRRPIVPSALSVPGGAGLGLGPLPPRGTPLAPTADAP